MPTGGGKRLYYQVPSLIRPGVGVVVSPLIALIKDQVDTLRQLGIRTAYLNSTLSAAASRAVEQALENGQLELLCIAPERLLLPRTHELLHRTQIILFAVDEAYCVSQWGHDFRPEYQQLHVLEEQFPQVPRVALTATADDRTRADIRRVLAWKGGQSSSRASTVRTSNTASRPNSSPNSSGCVASIGVTVDRGQGWSEAQTTPAATIDHIWNARFRLLRLVWAVTLVRE